MNATRMPTFDGDIVTRAHVLMFGATVLISTSFPVGAAITNDLDSLVLTFFRFAMAALLFAPIVAWRYGLRLPAPRDFARYGILSACLVAFFWGMFTALQYTSALNTATIFAMTPVITALVSAVLLKERLGATALIALPIGMSGAIWVIFRGDLNALLTLDLGVGDGIFFAATLVMGFYGPLVKYLHRGEPMAQMTFWTLVSGALWLFILAAPRFSSVSWHDVPNTVYIGIAYLAVFTTLITFFVLQWCTRVISPTKIISYTYLNPILVVIIAIIFGGHLPTLATYPGFILIVTAIYVLQRDKGDRRSGIPSKA